MWATGLRPGTLALSHPQLVFLGWHPSFPPLSAGFNFDFPSPSGKRILNEVPEEPAGWQATAAQGRPSQGEGGPSEPGSAARACWSSWVRAEEGESSPRGPHTPRCAHGRVLGSTGARSSPLPCPATGVRLPIRQERGEAPGSQLLIAAPLTHCTEPPPSCPAARRKHVAFLSQDTCPALRPAGGSAQKVNYGLEPQSPPRHTLISLSHTPSRPSATCDLCPGLGHTGTRASQDLRR